MDPLPGPRPAANPVQAAQRHAQALQALAQQPAQAVAVSVKVPFCAMQCLCCERVLRTGQDTPVVDAYADGLLEELQRVARLAGGGRDVLQLHLGGGTATLLGERQLLRLVQALQQHFRLPADAEMAVDADPRRIGALELRLLVDLGFRQLNLRTLDLDPVVLQAVGRRQSVAMVDSACELARGNGIDCVNLELMLGLPGQTLEGWQASLERVITLAPDRITLLRYQHQPLLSPVQHGLDARSLPSEAQVLAMALHTSRALCGAGYRWLGAEQFVLDADELAAAMDQARLHRGLIGYTTMPNVPTLGLGAGAVSEINGHVFWNPAEDAQWQQALRERALPTAHARESSPQRQQRDQAVQQLLCHQHLQRDTLDPSLHEHLLQLATGRAHGLLQVLPEHLRVTERGRHALPWLCQALDEWGDGANAGAAPRWWS